MIFFQCVLLELVAPNKIGERPSSECGEPRVVPLSDDNALVGGDAIGTSTGEANTLLSHEIMD